MTFSGKELKDLGCPQNKIKFFVGREYESVEALQTAINEHRSTPSKTDDQKEQDRILREDLDCAFNVLFELGMFPWSLQANSNTPSKREVRQWLDQGAVRINGKFPKAHETVLFPITDLVFFPGAKRQTTFQ